MYKTSKAKKIEGTLIPPGDKSISHRAILLSSIGKGKATIRHFLSSEDCLATAHAFQEMGVKISFLAEDTVEVEGKGKKGLKPPKKALDLGNSGTSMRLLAGLLAGQPFHTTLVGDASLSSRPMKRVTEPLTAMGAHITGDTPPLKIEGAPLKGKAHQLKIASAQVKSCLLLAGLYAEGETSVTEPQQSRDHTERMLQFLGVDLKKEGLTTSLKGEAELILKEMFIPGDISSAAFFMVAAACFPKAHLRLQNVGLNPTRTAILDVLKRMGASIEIIPHHTSYFEPYGDIIVQAGELKGTEISGKEIPLLIDEIPVLAVAGALAKGTTLIKDAKELRVKETDRIAAMCRHLKALGTHIEELPDGLRIEGPTQFKGGQTLSSFQDHRIAMSMAIAGLFCEEEIIIEETECIQTSFPNFETLLKQVVTYA